MSRGRKWTDEEVSRLRSLLAQGFSPKEIESYFGRSRGAVLGKLRYLQITNDQRRRRNELSRARRAGKTVVRLKGDNAVFVSRPPHEVIAERDRRYEITPRDLTAALLGDPLPGYSALDQRKSATR